MAKFCMKCGTPLQDGVRFCHKCGATVGQEMQQTPVQSQQPTYQQPSYREQPTAAQQPYYAQTQPYAPMPKKSNKKLIIGIIAIVAIIIVISLVLLLFVFGGANSELVGKWEMDNGYGMIWEFKSDKTLWIGYENPYIDYTATKVAKWEVKGDEVCLTPVENEYGTYTGCAKFKIDGDKLTITKDGSSMTYTKK